MRILFDLCHPAHVHFFKNPITQLQRQGHQILVTSRVKEIAIELVEQLGVEHHCISAHQGKGLIGMMGEMVVRDYRLYRHIRRFKPDVVTAIGGTFAAHAGWLSRTASVIFYDTENASLQNAITYPLASLVAVPECYEGWLPKGRHLRYRGYHELSYLHPNHFKTDRDRAIANGLASEGDTFFLRLVSWQANHDIGEKGWSPQLLQRMIDRLSPLGKILISSESPLPERFSDYRYQGKVTEVHQVMAYCRMVIGESATMASEAAVMGVPAIYIAHTGRGYTSDQEKKYGLVSNLFSFDWEPIDSAIEHLLQYDSEYWQQARSRLLSETIDVSDFVCECLTTPIQTLLSFQNQD